MSPPKNSVATCLWFDGQAEEAATFYTSLIPGSEIVSVLRAGPDGPAIMVHFTLAGTPYQALNGGPHYTLSGAVSISVSTEDQADTDRLWDALLADGGKPMACSWLEDRFGLCWQIVPEVLPRLLMHEDPEVAARAMQSMQTMTKIDIAALEAAARGDG